MAKYKNIEFAEGLNMPFADFKKTFQLKKVFRDVHPDIREKELIKAHKIACPLFYIDVKGAKEIKPNGNIATTTTKKRKTNSRKDSK